MFCGSREKPKTRQKLLKGAGEIQEYSSHISGQDVYTDAIGYQWKHSAFTAVTSIYRNIHNFVTKFILLLSLPNPCQKHSGQASLTGGESLLQPWHPSNPLTGSNFCLISAYLSTDFFNTSILAPNYVQAGMAFSFSGVYYPALPSFCQTKQPFPEYPCGPSPCSFHPSSFLLNHSHIQHLKTQGLFSHIVPLEGLCNSRGMRTTAPGLVLSRSTP